MSILDRHNQIKSLDKLLIYNYLKEEDKQNLKNYTYINEIKTEGIFYDDYTIWEYSVDIIKNNNIVGKLIVICGNKNGDIESVMRGAEVEYEYKVKIKFNI